MSTITSVIPTEPWLRKKLREHFGYRAFRPGQVEAVSNAFAGKDTLILMPTGSGKSLCYQLPALELEGMTIVVSPLISLMKDQADSLRERGISVAVVNSSNSAAEAKEAEEAIQAGKVEFVYATPERLAVPEFRQLLKKQIIDMIVIDEAHCVSQWGHDFRPDYLLLAHAIKALGSPPVLAMTATATADVTDDILRLLDIPEADVVSTGFYRDNLNLSILEVAGDEEKREHIDRMLTATEGTGIIYCATVQQVEDLIDWLPSRGHSVASYHGRMSRKQRTMAQDDFMSADTRIMVATNAFGLGIDKPNIRWVIHYHVPGSLDAYYQEFGRAGRDGERAEAMLLADPSDRKLHKFFNSRKLPKEEDLVNSYHALGKFKDTAVKFVDLAAVCPLSQARLRHCLAIFIADNIVRREKAGRFRLLRHDLAREEVVRAGNFFGTHADNEQIRLQQMIDFCNRATCRWKALLDYFESDELGDKPHCDHCDNCVGILANGAVA